MSRGVVIEADDIFSESLLQDRDFDAIVLPGGLGGAKAFSANPLLI